MKRTLFRDGGRAAAALALSFGLLLASCADGLEPAEGSDGSAVRFTVSAVQDFGTRALHAEDGGVGCEGRTGAGTPTDGSPEASRSPHVGDDNDNGDGNGKWGFGETAGDSACFPRTDDVAGASGDNSPEASGIIACTSEGDLGEVYLIESEEEYGAYGAYGESGADDRGAVSGSNGKDDGNGKEGGSGSNGKDDGSGKEGGSGSNGKNGRDDAARILTRANITTAISEKFSTIGYRGATGGAGISTPPWFHNAETNPNGTLVTPVYWWDTHPYACFYAIYPYTANGTTDKIRLSPASYPSMPPYVDFETEQDVKKQKDLLTACSGEVHYATHGVHPQTDLKFWHALTAVHFRVGPNLSWSRKITKVEIIDAQSKGRYTLGTDKDNTGAAWSNLSDPKTFTLGGDGTVSVPLNKVVGSVIMGNAGDNYTFYMIPQPLTGVSVKIYFDNGATPAITANLKGTWKPGTVKTYSLSQTNSDWQYHLTVTSPAAAAYDATSTGNYTVTSYRKDPVTSTQQSVAWEVVSYQESVDGGATFGSETTVRPVWLTALSLEQGDGGTTAETGTATIQAAALIDHLAPYNQELQNAALKGSDGNPYNLSNATGDATVENTANSYLISAPGWYRVPLVYGNAIKNGNDNPSAYQTANTGTYILQHFKDHAGVDITSPYINVQNASDPATQAGIVWTDQSGIVTDLGVEGSGTGAFVRFHVPQDKIKNGNAVISVKNASGTVMWSWHLWFDHSDVLQTVACTNHQNVVYHFTKQTLGFAWRRWEETQYTRPRVARVKVEQTLANGGVKQFAYIDITQNNCSVKGISTTYYQFGRKDALPGVQTVSDGSHSFDNTLGGRSLDYAIRHPENMFGAAGGTESYKDDWCNATYHNLWSMDNTMLGFNDNPVVKTVYDPCPAGFHMPASNAFTGFTTTGSNTKNPTQFNVSGDWDMGWNFKVGGSSTNTVYFPASGFRSRYNGSLYGVGEFGFYWSAVPYSTDCGCALASSQEHVYPQEYGKRLLGFSARPVME